MCFIVRTERPQWPEIRFPRCPSLRPFHDRPNNPSFGVDALICLLPIISDFVRASLGHSIVVIQWVFLSSGRLMSCTGLVNPAGTPILLRSIETSDIRAMPLEQETNSFTHGISISVRWIRQYCLEPEEI